MPSADPSMHVARQPDNSIEVEYPEHPDSLLRNEAVPRFVPFPGLRYARSHVRLLDDVVCPPYDVISDSERIALESRHPANIVRLELPADDGDPSQDRYARARILLDAWRDGGIFQRDPNPCFYGYRMTFTDPAGVRRQTLGVIGALGLEEPGTGILPHEETTPKAKTDRMELLRATSAPTSRRSGACRRAAVFRPLCRCPSTPSSTPPTRPPRFTSCGL